MTKVLVLGGGVAGLSAAQELGQRGFEVTIWEASDAVGGRAKSRLVENLPAEHGFHFFPAFYRHLRDTLARIPDQEAVRAAGGNMGAWIPGQPFAPQSVTDELVASSRVVLARSGQTELPFNFDVQSWSDALGMARSFAGLGLSASEIGLAMAKLARVIADVSSGADSELEQITWWDFIEADSQSKAYQSYLGNVAVRWTVAMDPRKASARTIGRIATQFWMSMAAANATGATSNGAPAVPFAQVLSGPTSTTWLEPWSKYLKGRLNVQFALDHEVVRIDCDNRREVTGVLANSPEGPVYKGLRTDFDYCICALPIPAFIHVIDRSRDLREAEPAVRKIVDLRRSMNWMVGLQFYLKKDVPVGRGGIMLRDAPWALTATSQLQFWTTKKWTRTGDGGIEDPPFPPCREQAVKGILSVIIADWEARGHFQNLTAKACDEKQLFWEVWQELKAHLNNQVGAGDEREDVLNDEDLIGYVCSIKRELVASGALRELAEREAQQLRDAGAEALDDLKYEDWLNGAASFTRAFQRVQAEEAAVGGPPTEQSRIDLENIQSCLDQEVVDIGALAALVEGCRTLPQLLSAFVKCVDEGTQDDASRAFQRLREYVKEEWRWVNPDPMFINTVDSAKNRPQAVTGLRNFFIAGDYVRTHTDLATMEAANESARRAVNGILDDADSPAARCGVWPLKVPLRTIAEGGMRQGAAAVGVAGRRGLDSAVGALRSFVGGWRRP